MTMVVRASVYPTRHAEAVLADELVASTLRVAAEGSVMFEGRASPGTMPYENDTLLSCAGCSTLRGGEKREKKGIASKELHRIRRAIVR